MMASSCPSSARAHNVNPCVARHVRASGVNREIGTDLGVTKQERALIELFSPEPGGDLVVALAGVARPTSRHHVPKRVTTAAGDRQNAVALKRPLGGPAVRAPLPCVLQSSPLRDGQVVSDPRHPALAPPCSPSAAAATHGHGPQPRAVSRPEPATSLARQWACLRATCVFPAHLAASPRVWLLSGVPAFVLLPGAGGSAWVWSRVVPVLTEAGHEAIAVDLPGDDQAAGLPRYAELVVDAIGPRSDVVLVAGSLGGFTAPLVCERVPVRELVLVNAMIPQPGETARDWWAHTGALEAQEEAARTGGYGPFDVATYFLHDVDAQIAAEGEPYQRSEADIAFESVCDFRAWPASRVRVLAGADDRFFPVGLQRRIAHDRLGVEADVLPGGHLLPLVQPQLVADYLLHTGATGRP
jgi:hypothetical protein